MTGIPASVKVGYRDYQIISWEHRNAAGANRYGECSHMECIIRVDETYGHREAAKTLLHEILHACFAVFPIYEKDSQEEIVQGMSQILSTVWRDNPGVMAWIDEGLCEAPP